MARTIQAPNIQARGERLKLPISSVPIFVRVDRGLAIGYRRNKTNGSWNWLSAV